MFEHRNNCKETVMLFDLPPTPRIIMEKISAGGFSCYLVGGCVRDMLLSSQPSDYDFVTDRSPEEIIAAAAEAGWKAWQHGISFGVVNVLVQEKNYEIATMRAEYYGVDPHRPAKVEFLSDIAADLARRDFTINAMAMDRHGRIIDPFGGQEDLKNGLIRCVGNPRDRFLEDPLRILRAARFMAKTGFAPEPGIAASSTDGAVHRRFTQLSVERVRNELEKILLAPYPSHGMRHLVQTEVLALSCNMKKGGNREPVPVLPEITVLQGIRQNPRFHAHDVLEHTLRSVDEIAPRAVLRWAALLHDAAKGRPEIRCLNKRGEPADYGHASAGARLAQTILVRLRVPREQALMVVWLVRNHMIHSDMNDRHMYRWIKQRARDFKNRKEFVDAARQLFLLADADNKARGRGADPAYIAAVSDCFQRVLAHTVLYPGELEIGGDCLAQKVGKGPLVGKILRDLLIDVQTGRLINSKKELQAAVDKKVKRLILARAGDDATLQKSE